MLGDMYLVAHKLIPTSDLCIQHRWFPSWAKPGAQDWHAVSILVQALAHLSLVQCGASTQHGPVHHLHPQAPGSTHPYLQGLAWGSTHSSTGLGCC